MMVEVKPFLDPVVGEEGPVLPLERPAYPSVHGIGPDGLKGTS